MVTVTINEQTNPKQVAAFNAVMGMVAYFEACKTAEREGKKRPKPQFGYDTQRQFFYGGAIRGGKTYLYLTILVLLCRRYPGSKWHVIRESFPSLTGNTEPALRRILGTSQVRWKRGSAEYYVQFPNGSRIYFLSENFERDRDLNRFKGLETNGFLLEQVEELQYDTYQKCIERAGSWYLDDQPPPLILGTFNPAFNWVKEIIYDAWITSPDGVDFHYTPALPSDNSKVTREQWDQWKKLDPVTYQRYIEGLWELDLKGRFFHTFQQAKHIGPVEYDPSHPLIYAFDFNVDPSVATVIQTDKETFFHVLDEVRIENGDTPAVCAELRKRWSIHDPFEQVTGDASGLARMSGLKGHLNQFQVIKRELELPEDRFILSSTNPEHADSRVFCCSVIANFPAFRVHPRCKYTIHDLNFVEIVRDKEGVIHIKKTGKLKNAPMGAESMGHLSDTLRYAMHNWLFEFVTIPKS